MLTQLSRGRTDRHGLDHGTVEVLDQQRHAALPSHAHVRVMAHEGDADRTDRPRSVQDTARHCRRDSPFRRSSWARHPEPAPDRPPPEP